MQRERAVAVLLFSCKHCSDEVSTWSKLDGHTYQVLSCSVQKSFHYNVLQDLLLFTCKANNVYKHFNTLVHIGPSKSRCLQSFIYISIRVFEIISRET